MARTGSTGTEAAVLGALSGTAARTAADWRLALTAANELSYMNKSNDAPAEDYALIPEGAIEDLALRSEASASSSQSRRLPR